MHEATQLSSYSERMLFGRNESMAQRLASLARDGKLRFVVVGVGHMVGARGIPALVRDYGFRVDRVRGRHEDIGGGARLPRPAQRRSVPRGGDAPRRLGTLGAHERLR